jgi:hypothetical protein
MAAKKPAPKKEPEPEETTAVAPQMPDYLKAFMNQSQADTGALVASSISVPRLSYRGKRWRFIVDGEEELVKSLTVDVVILGVEPEAGRFIKTLYLKAYTPGDTTPPDCSSSNGIAPDVWVSSPQSQRCASCPKNVFGSAQSRSGGKAKACHDSKRLWVIKPDDTSTVYGLNVPIMSLKNLAEYGKYIAQNNYPLALVVTELSMEDETEFPKLCFNHKGFLQEEFVKDAIDINTRRPWKSTQIAIPFDGPIPALPGPGASPAPGPSAFSQERKVPTGEGIDAVLGQWETK